MAEDGMIPAPQNNQGDDLLCRFCATGEQEEKLVTPCQCEGTVSSAHRSCLEKRILQNGLTHCALCNFKYEFKFKTKSMAEWLVSQDTRRDVFQLMSMLTQYICDSVVIVIAVAKSTEFMAKAPLVVGMITALCCGMCAIFWIVVLLLDLWAYYLPLRRWQEDNMTVVLFVPERSPDTRAPDSCESTDELRGD
ncbi:uncharacterized protein LOC144163305 [Haemaphysalis longicornis]